MSEELVEIAATAVDVANDAVLDKEKASNLAHRAVQFLVHCFKCKNEKCTTCPVRRDSVEIKRARNAYQLSGICDVCGTQVRGFVKTSVARDHGVIIEPPAKAEETAKKTRKRKHVEISISTAVDTVAPETQPPAQ